MFYSYYTHVTPDSQRLLVLICFHLACFFQSLSIRALVRLLFSVSCSQALVFVTEWHVGQ